VTSLATRTFHRCIVVARDITRRRFNVAGEIANVVEVSIEKSSTNVREGFGGFEGGLEVECAFTCGDNAKDDVSQTKLAWEKVERWVEVEKALAEGSEKT
jgi:hypothetical protein